MQTLVPASLLAPCSFAELPLDRINVKQPAGRCSSYRWLSSTAGSEFRLVSRQAGKSLARPARRAAGRRQVARSQATVSTEESVVAQDDAAAPPPSVEQHVRLLKQAAHTRKTPPREVFQALYALERTKLGDTSHFLPTLGGDASPGRTWMLIFTAGAKELKEANKGGQGGGSYFPLTAVQRFDATAMEIENGVYLGPVGRLTFRGPMGWTGRRLAFTFHTLSIQLGSWGPFQFKIGKKEDEGRSPGVGKEGAKDPFFTWFYADDEIIAARGRGGGSAFWVRCERNGSE